jgi:hypothetical protein
MRQLWLTSKNYAYSNFSTVTAMKRYACVCSSSLHPPAVLQQYISFRCQTDGTEHKVNTGNTCA